MLIKQAQTEVREFACLFLWVGGFSKESDEQDGGLYIN